MSKAIVSIKHMNKLIKGVPILIDINLMIHEGTICGIVGKNGSGKSMLFKCLTNLVNISSGSIEINGIQIPSQRESMNVGVLIEYPGFLSNFSGYNNLKMLASINGIVKSDEIKTLMIRLGIDPNDKRLYKHLSLGMRQKLGIASALMEKSPLIILDEPTNNVDSNSVDIIMEIIKEYNKNYNITFLLTSHHIDEIRSLCSVLYEIKEGKLFPYEGEK